MAIVRPSDNADLGGCTPEAIVGQLARILASAEFDASERNRRFLAYVVEETVAGRSGRIKAYTIATTVFGRDASFDSQVDSIVRMEAGRLRRSLERYNLLAGANDPVRITIPTGTYVPRFSPANPPEAGQSDVAAEPARLDGHAHARDFQTSILVMPFEEEGGLSSYPNFTRGFTRQLVACLTRFIGLNVYGYPVSGIGGPEEDLSDLRTRFGVDFCLTGGTTLSADRFSVEVLLIDSRTGRCVWAENYDRALQPAGVFQIRDDVAASIARTLAPPYGILSNQCEPDAEGRSPGLMASIDSVNLFYRYWRTYDSAMLGPVIAGLERAIRNDPDFADAFACLSLAISNSVRFGPSLRSETIGPLERARHLAHRAIELAPHSSRGYFAMSLACWFGGDVKGGFKMLETGLALNPNDTETMAELGFRCAMRADWDRAVPLIEDAYRRNPALPSGFRLGLSLWHYVSGRYEDAFSEAVRMDTRHVVYTHVMQAISSAKLGRKADADLAIASIFELHPDYAAQIADDLHYRNVDPGLAEIILQGLFDAGFPRGGASAAAAETEPSGKALTTRAG